MILNASLLNRCVHPMMAHFTKFWYRCACTCTPICSTLLLNKLKQCPISIFWSIHSTDVDNNCNKFQWHFLSFGCIQLMAYFILENDLHLHVWNGKQCDTTQYKQISILTIKLHHHSQSSPNLFNFITYTTYFFAHLFLSPTDILHFITTIIAHSL